ncbi:4'-phosphopantetheinyl transferase family protein [Streptomyces sp. NPDC002402]
MIERILPSVIAAHHAFGDAVDAELFPQEAAVVAAAVAARRREFATVRRCARESLATLGIPPMPLLPGERGAPLWPRGTVGSMTHCPGYRAAAVARADEITALGIDAEPHQPLPEGVLDAISLPEERAHLSSLGADRHWDRLLFSAKESVYKTWFPLTHRWLDFHEASVSFQPAERTFIAELLVPGPRIGEDEVRRFHGRWLVDQGIVLTAIALLPARPNLRQVAREGCA